MIEIQDDFIRDLMLGFIKIHILHHANKEEIYGTEFQEELARHGYEISYGTLYPMFHKLINLGLLTMTKKNVNGKIRKYYTITPKGKEILSVCKEKSKELVDELFED